MTNISNVRTFTSATEAALWYVEQGIFLVPVAYRGKNPKGNEWEKLRIDAASIQKYFNGEPQNVGGLLGISALGPCGLIDVDLDAPEAIAVASALLPATGFIFGRASKPASHRFYLADPPVRLQQFKDPLTKSMLVELRGLKKTDGAVGLQTVLPGSVHVSGEPIIFEAGHDSGPTTVAGDVLISAVRAVAAGALLCRYWPAHGRHDSMLALAGALARGGWLVNDALVFCRALYRAVPTHDPDAVSRVDSEVKDSFAKVAVGEAATGFPSLTEHIDKKVVAAAFDWLGIKAAAQGGSSVEGGADWQRQFLRSKNGTPKPVLANVLLVLQNEDPWLGVLGYNEFNLCTVTQKPAPWPQSRAGATWTDFDDSQFAAWTQRYGIMINSRIAAEAAQTIAQMNPFHPIRNYLQPLIWDGKPRVSKWLALYLGVADNAYTCAVGGCWLISAVARVFEPGCQVDHLLLLEGPQGVLKSSSLRTLVGNDWFSEGISDLSGKDSRGDLLGKWVVELSELSAMRRAEVERVKAFISCRIDHYRPPYGRRSVDIPRQSIFCGTTNDENPFVDPTGNRRFWPVKVGCINIPALAKDRDQLWAEAFALYKSGTKWWLDSPELNQIATGAQDERYQPGIWDEEILNFCDNPRPRLKRDEDRIAGDVLYELPFDSTRDRVTINDCLIHGLGKTLDKLTYADQIQVQRCLTHAGWKRQPQSRVRGTDRRVRFYLRPEVQP
jgi:predicted P-loop ATPase